MTNYEQWRRKALVGRESDRTMHEAVYLIDTAVDELRLVKEALAGVSSKDDAAAIVRTFDGRLTGVMRLIDTFPPLD